jgi:hypothetical protein
MVDDRSRIMASDERMKFSGLKRTSRLRAPGWHADNNGVTVR